MAEEKNTLSTIEIIFQHDKEVKRRELKNNTWADLMKLRDNIFRVGMMYNPGDEPGHYIIVSPFCIISIDVWVQDGFHKGKKDTITKVLTE